MNKLSPENVMRRPYERILIPEIEGGYSAYVGEFEGCVAEGESAEEALRSLESTAIAWIEAELESGRDIPAPRNEQEYSGKFLLRMPKSLHRQLARQASNEGISLNQYILYRLSGSTTETLKPINDEESTITSLVRSVNALAGTYSEKLDNKGGSRGRDHRTGLTEANKESPKLPRGRDSVSGQFTTVKHSKQRSRTTQVERVPKPGYGDKK